ncbi:MAG: MFS transporter [Cytophagales bacterium]
MEAVLQLEEKKSSINWNQIYSLVALNAAVVISWIAYHNYQPKVLQLFHFEELALFLVVAQAVILIFIPPIAGLIGDYMIKSNGNRFIVFTVGTSVTAMVFMCVAFTVGTATTLDFTAALPFMIVVWLISMNIFHSPANSMMELFADAKQLPTAMALMTLTTELLYALEPVVVWFVDLIGPVPTFALGGFLLIVTGYFFRATTKNISLTREYDETKAKKSNFPLVLTVGMMLGLATGIIMNTFPGLLASRLQDYSNTALGGSHFVSFILGISALAAWPLSTVVTQIGMQKGVLYGCISTFICIVLVFLTNDPIYCGIACVLLGVSYSLLNVSSFPFILTNLSARTVTFGAGIFFGSIELADGLMNIFVNL